jgi:hypothetical protein
MAVLDSNHLLQYHNKHNLTTTAPPHYQALNMVKKSKLSKKAEALTLQQLVPKHNHGR